MVVSIDALGQKVAVRAQNEPLDEILLRIRDQYTLQLSFNASELAKYKITIDADFDNPDLAMEGILKSTPLTFTKNKQVYIIYTRPPEFRIPEKKVFSVGGRIYDESGTEPLPYAVVTVNRKQFLSNENGQFFYQTVLDSIFRIKVEYLGYAPFDTIVFSGANLNILLPTSLQLMSEVKVKAKLIHYASQMGNRAAVLRLNPQIANYLPGNGDNAIFNLLRLQPGILAAGEYSTDLIIWGNYKGQSILKFDGYRVFGNYNFNDNISSINPFIVKDIQVYKAAYQASFGNAVSGIVNMTGISGSRDHVDVKLNMNTNTLGTAITIPLGSKNSLVLASRQAFVNWLQPGNVANVLNLNPRFETVSDIVLYPNYTFSDYNLRFTGSMKDKADYYASFFVSKDRFNYSLTQEEKNLLLQKSQVETNSQMAGAAGFNFMDEKTGAHQIVASLSNLHVVKSDSVNFERPKLKKVAYRNYINSSEDISEWSLSYLNTTPVYYNSQWIWGAEWLLDRVDMYEENNFNTSTIDTVLTCNALTTHLTHKYSVDSTLIIETGMRISYFTSLKQDLWMPRLSIVYRTGRVELRLAGGIYNQVLQENMKVDMAGNIRYQWMLASVDEVPLLEARHLVLGAKYQRNDFSFLGEVFMKNTFGITRFVNNSNGEKMYEGKSQAYGLDLYAKQEYKGSSLWVSYTMGFVYEHFPYFKNAYWQPALQDQRHEVKMACLLDLHPIYLGANFIWGSGFPDATPNRTEEYDLMDYNRVDVSMVYRLLARGWKMELGASILNVFDHENFKYESFNRIPRNQLTSFTVYTDAMRFTPTLFLNLVF